MPYSLNVYNFNAEAIHLATLVHNSSTTAVVKQSN
jgi:hypothetical protein